MPQDRKLNIRRHNFLRITAFMEIILFQCLYYTTPKLPSQILKFHYIGVNTQLEGEKRFYALRPRSIV
jgi:hypothetical protein